MKVLRVHGGQCIFRLENGERDVLKLILSLYPIVPSAHQPLSKSSPAVNAENQRLLDEALAEQRQENQARVRAFLEDGSRLRQLKDSVRLVVSAQDMEWLLQVLNDVRVGQWILLGSPDENLWHAQLDGESAPRAWAMEVAGYFQAQFLEAMRKL